MPYRQQKIISHSSRGWRSEIRVPAWSGSGEGPLPGYRLPTSCILIGQKEAELALWLLHIRAVIPFMRAPPLWPNYAPRVLPPNAITLRVRFQHMNFFWRRDTNIPLLTLLLVKCCVTLQKMLSISEPLFLSGWLDQLIFKVLTSSPWMVYLHPETYLSSSYRNLRL